MTPSIKTQIRLIAWNCAGNFARKSAIIEEMRPDVVVISEAEQDAADALPDASGGFWIGNGRRGLAVVALNGWRLEHAEVQVAERLFLPVRLSRGGLTLRVVGACVKKTTDYVGPTLSALEQLGSFLRAEPAIVAGDFNQSAALDGRRASGRRFARVIERLDELRFRSAWHSFKEEQMGAESKPTFFWRWQDQPQSRFHIDYAFVSRDIAINWAALGDHRPYVEAGLSDHVPLLVDVSI